jgi:hypothetical protein
LFKNLEPKYEKSQTLNFKLIGAYSRSETVTGTKGYSDLDMYAMYQEHLMTIYDIPFDAARYLVYQYGTMSLRVAKLGENRKLNEKVHNDFPFLKS